MIHWRYGTVLDIRTERPGIQELSVATPLGEGVAVLYTNLIGRARRGDRVLLNVTAVALGLGTGGRHFVAAIIDRPPPDPESPGHLMKLRYTPFQLRCRTVEERADTPWTLTGQVVVVGELHSQLLPAVLALRAHCPPGTRIAYIMTDGGALPLAFSETAAAMKDAGLINSTVTIGNAFGGDRESLNIYSGLLTARHDLRADISLVMMGPGVAGSASRFGHTGVEQAQNSDAVSILGGRPVVIPRISFADPRERHHGLSHHTRTVCGIIAQRRAYLPIPILAGPQLDHLLRQIDESGAIGRHDLALVAADAILPLLAAADIPAKTMGRTPAEDPAFFLAAGAAGFLAARLYGGTSPG